MNAGLLVFFFGLAAMMAVAAGEMLLLALLGFLAERVPKATLKRLMRWLGG